MPNLNLTEKLMGMYLHIPFCERKCPYCDFYSVKADESMMEAYTESLIRAIHRQEESYQVDTIYFGGGTPNLLGAERLNRLVEQIAKRHRIAKNAEITLEANPNSLSKEALDSLIKGGFNRISIGAQSASEHELSLLGRSHGFSEVEAAVFAAESAGFKHISLDSMIALPGQSAGDVCASIASLAALPIDHMSVYLLKIEQNTKFSSIYKEELDADLSADLYLAAVDELKAKGFTQYEISNFSKRGGESRHNLKYWRLTPYIGIGPSAHSYYGGERSFFPRDIKAFIAAENPNTLRVSDGSGGGADEYVMLGLRLTEGISVIEAAEYGLDTKMMLRRIPQLCESGYALFDGDKLSLTPAGFLISNSIIAHLLA